MTHTDITVLISEVARSVVKIDWLANYNSHKNIFIDETPVGSNPGSVAPQASAQPSKPPPLYRESAANWAP